MPSVAPYSKPYDRRICHRCIGDPDLVEYIKNESGPRGCSFCKKHDARTADFREFVDHVRSILNSNFSKAAEELPFESAEGGYQAWTTDTYDLLYDSVGLELPRDEGDLRGALVEAIGDDVWCDYDWVVLDHDQSLEHSWRRFCEITKSRRRFFFHDIGASDGRDPDARSPLEFLKEICDYASELKLVKSLDAGFRLYRARNRSKGKKFLTPKELGPPPSEYATQSNRMNPPGISMLYGANRRALTIAETRGERVSVGTFETTRKIRILDLAKLPPIPGFFSHAPRDTRLTLRFLHGFSNSIIQPVDRDDRVNVDYIPTQVFTEFLRDYQFRGGGIDGVRYRSATGVKGYNIVLFAEPENVEGATEQSKLFPIATWLRMVGVKHIGLRRAPKRR